jgi:HSP20 family protein
METEHKEQKMTLYIQPYYPYRRVARRVACAPEADRALPVNIREEEQAYVLTALVPGLKADDLNIQIVEDVVRIEGAFQQDENEYLLNELPRGAFRRVLRLPVPLNADKAEAKITDGVLTLRLPKAEAALPKKIKVNVK